MMPLQDGKKKTQRTNLVSACIADSECQLGELSRSPQLIFKHTWAHL